MKKDRAKQKTEDIVDLDLFSKLLSINEDDGEDEAVDYGDGEFVAAAFGDGPDGPDDVSGKKFRLPDGHPVPGDILKTDAVSGGWGYTMRDAAVIQGGIPGEHAFIEFRIGEELRYLEKSSGIKLVYVDHNKFAQELIREGNDSYDFLSVQIEVIPEADWDQLKADWESHGGYKKDRKGRRNHENWRESRTIRFTEHFWFNVNALFDIDGEDGEDMPDA